MVVAAALMLLLAAGAPPTLGPQHYVIDEPGVLTNTTMAWIAQNLQAFQEQTGHPVLVVIARSSTDAPAENFAGDDGAVLFLWLHGHDAAIVVGSRLNTELNDAVTARILDDVVRPRMRREDADGAASYGVDAIIQAIAPQYANVAPARSPPPVLFGRAFMYTAVWLVVAAIVASLIVRAISWVR